MTAINARPIRDSTESLLRFALRADATLCAGVGLFVAMAADPLSRLSGLTSTSEWIAGAAMVIYGVALYMAAGLSDVRRVGMGVLAGNVAFARRPPPIVAPRVGARHTGERGRVENRFATRTKRRRVTSGSGKNFAE